MATKRALNAKLRCANSKNSELSAQQAAKKAPPALANMAWEEAKCHFCKEHDALPEALKRASHPLVLLQTDHVCACSPGWTRRVQQSVRSRRKQGV